MLPHPANYVFVVKDHHEGNKDGWIRVNDIRDTWRSLLKAAGVPCRGPERLVRHDLRRTWNVEAEHFRGLNAQMRSSQMGNSVGVNKLNYAGVIDKEILKLRAKIERSDGSNLLKFINQAQARPQAQGQSQAAGKGSHPASSKHRVVSNTGEGGFSVVSGAADVIVDAVAGVNPVVPVADGSGSEEAGD